jgi:gliding motility-associated-like protein
VKNIFFLLVFLISLRLSGQVQASFVWEVNSNTCVSFTSTSTGNITSYDWQIQDIITPTFNDTSFITYCFFDTGCCVVSLIVSDQFGNSDTASQMVCTQLHSSLFVPTAFTPNGDGVNDVFFAEGMAIQWEGFQMEIYSRWGQTIFSSNDITKGWDGSVTGSGEIAPMGPYLVAIVWYDTEHKKNTYKNTVLLLR